MSSSSTLQASAFARDDLPGSPPEIFPTSDLSSRILSDGLGSISPRYAAIRITTGLPKDITLREFRLIFMFASEFMGAELARFNDQIHGIVRFRTGQAAIDALNHLQARKIDCEDPAADEVRVELLQVSPPVAANGHHPHAHRTHSDEALPFPASSTFSPPRAPFAALSSSNSSTTSNAAKPRSAFDAFYSVPSSQQRNSTSGMTLGGLPNNSYSANVDHLSNSDNFFSEVFGPSSPRSERPFYGTGKNLLLESATFDDEEEDLVKDPLGYLSKSGNAGSASAPWGESISSRMSSSVGSSMPPLSSPPVSRFSALNVNTGSMPPPAGPSTVGIPPMSPTSTQNYLQNHFPNYPGRPPIILNPADQNPPCNTLYVGNLPPNTSEDELKALFSRQRGYKRLCFRTKAQGPMCFVEFEDVRWATKALMELYGNPLSNSVKGGIRLSFSKNPLGVRSNSISNPNNMSGPMAMANHPSAFSTAMHAPPGLTSPPSGGVALNQASPPQQPAATGPTGIFGHGGIGGVHGGLIYGK
ncbi:hypothetical protein SAICODRAFT_23681 [Saitoella complicata NRRL Y-17804]|uniref:RRM domain-containing protein n=1 Tax=Saitoella complicata (strain BCRC 22490 / CBS 7301 / JCM 7358 / NBRC 10748 / NRRL Y-17804) TaxID=698492 RepID=A0A0E9NPE7_SAICN|nr:uncharacterized protein SAICODRAFT_23681 [Saitoella complicata NRRL Y-17804]ODQ54982.1 hypothetical protein SAICODRAFT_23681 [Saitoella complicata NRRL Y-17804]GAO51546.1 hypothetical protein G7K_5645-t1 [Saitoella complicata NRRL Y-17804]